MLTLLLQVHTALSHDYWDITIDIALAFAVDQGNRNVRVCNTLPKRDAEDARGRIRHCMTIISIVS